MWNSYNNWEFGEVGIRLDSNRDNEIYNNSAKEINNGYITEMGTIRCMKKFLPNNILAVDIIEVLETKFNFYLIITETKMYTYSYSHVMIAEFNISTLKGSVCRIFANSRLGTVQKGYNKFYNLAEDGTDITAVNYIQSISPPISNKGNVICDVHRVYEIEVVEGVATGGEYIKIKKKILEKIGDAIVNPILHLDSAGLITIDSISGNVARIYQEKLNLFRPIYSDTPIEDGGDITMDELNYSDLILNFHTEFEPNMLFQAEPFEFIDSGIDVERTYWKKASGKSGKGDLYTGEAIDLLDDIVTFAVFQNRLVFITEDTMHFSRINQYLNFTNGVSNNDAFYIKPNPISNEESILINCISGRSLFISSNKGIYQIVSTQLITPNAIDLRIVSDMGATNQLKVINSTLFFKGYDGNLYAIQESATLDNKMDYFVVEKYDLYSDIEHIDVIMLDKKKRLICTTSELNKVLMYTLLDNENEFQRVTFELSYTLGEKLFTIYDSLVKNGELLLSSNENYENFNVKIHQPSVITESGGSLLNDLDTRIKVISCNTVNEFSEQIKSVELGEIKASNRALELRDQTVYTVKCDVRSAEGFYIDILTEGGSGIVELMAVEYDFKVAGRY